MKQAAKILFLLLTLAGLSGCIKKPKFPDVPEITYKDFIITEVTPQDIRGELIFNFTDGDGNVGLKQEDTVPPFDRAGAHYYNFYMDYFVKINGEFVKKEPLVPFYYRIPYLEPEGKNKTLQGKISVRDITPFPITLTYDTVKFVFYMEDRDFNKSNVAMTEEIIRP